jgi:hypothetical protein
MPKHSIMKLFDSFLKNTLKPWHKQESCFLKVSAAFVTARETMGWAFMAFFRRESRNSIKPQQGSWQNITEIKLAVLANSRLTLRIPGRNPTMLCALEANVRESNLMVKPN